MHVYILTESETGKFLGVYDSQKNAVDSIKTTYINTGHIIEYRQITSCCLLVFISDITKLTITKREVQAYSEHL